MGIGIVNRNLRNFEDAPRRFERARDVSREIGRLADVAKALNNTGVVHECLGQYRKALQSYEEALDLSRELGRKADTARVLNNIGVVQRRIGNYDEALEQYEQSLRIFRTLGNLGAVALTYNNIGSAFEGLGRLDDAQEAYNRARGLLHESSSEDVKARVRWSLAALHLRRRQPELALAQVREGLEHVSALSEGLAEGESAGARDAFSGLFDVGYRAALASGHVFAFSDLMERGRAESLRESLGSRAAPRWLVTDKHPVLRGGLVQRLLTGHGILRRCGAVGRHGSIARIERTWRSLKTEYVRHLFLHRPIRALEAKLQSWRSWHNGHRSHQGLGQRTPDDVYRGRRPRKVHNVAAGTLSVRFLDGDHRLPVLRLRCAA